MSTEVTDLLEEVLAAARGRGIDQRGLARAAGVAAETISRAKRRGNIELRTLAALAAAAGMQLRVEPAARSRQQGDAPPRSTLADPKWGLAWSNQQMGVRGLVTNALLKGDYDAILEAVTQHGMALVQGQWQELKETRPARVSKRTVASVDRMLRNITRGFARAQG